MSSFDWKKNVEDSIKDGLIITATTTGIFYALEAANIKLPKASMDAMEIMKLAGSSHWPTVFLEVVSLHIRFHSGKAPYMYHKYLIC